MSWEDSEKAGFAAAYNKEEIALFFLSLKQNAKKNKEKTPKNKNKTKKANKIACLIWQKVIK